MSEYDKPIKEWNAVTYLRDFINTQLILNAREQAIWDYLQRNSKQPPTFFHNKPRAIKYRCCKRCGEIKTLDEFDGGSYICEECRRQEKIWKQYQQKN